MIEQSPEEIYAAWRVIAEPSIKYLKEQDDKTLQEIGSRMNSMLAMIWALSTRTYVEGS